MTVSVRETRGTRVNERERWMGEGREGVACEAADAAQDGPTLPLCTPTASAACLATHQFGYCATLIVDGSNGSTGAITAIGKNLITRNEKIPRVKRVTVRA